MLRVLHSLLSLTILACLSVNGVSALTHQWEQHAHRCQSSHSPISHDLSHGEHSSHDEDEPHHHHGCCSNSPVFTFSLEQTLEPNPLSSAFSTPHIRGENQRCHYGWISELDVPPIVLTA